MQNEQPKSSQVAEMALALGVDVTAIEISGIRPAEDV
jgi:hypothetical protein